MPIKLKYQQLLFLCSSCILLLSSCVHYSYVNTDIRADYQLVFDTSGSCTLEINGESRINDGQIQADSDFDFGSILCSQKIRHYAISVQVDYSPAAVTNDFTDQPKLNEPRSNGTRVKISMGNERQAGVKITGGICLNVFFASSRFWIKKESLNDGGDKFTLYGKGNYYCPSQF